MFGAWDEHYTLLIDILRENTLRKERPLVFSSKGSRYPPELNCKYSLMQTGPENSWKKSEQHPVKQSGVLTHESPASARTLRFKAPRQPKGRHTDEEGVASTC